MSQAEALAEGRTKSPVVSGRQRPGRSPAWLMTMPPLIRVCCLILIGFGVAAIGAPVIAREDPGRQDLVNRLQPPVGFGGSMDRPLGTDHLGRDILSRTIHGARVSLGIGLVGLTIGVTIGVTIGLLAGMRGGLLDEAMMFLVDVQLALPFIVIALVAIALFGSTLTVLILVMGFAYWESYARLTRGMVLGARESQYVQAAEALGAGSGRILVRHVLPNVVAPVVVLGTFLLTGLILLESTLSFLGIGVQPPTPSWGSMIGEGRNYLNTAWWIAVVPGVAIMLATMSISLLGDWLRDVLDPTVRTR